MNPLNLPGPQFLLFYGLVFTAALVAAAFVRRSAKGPGGMTGARPIDLSPYELASLAGGPVRAVQAALVSLVNRKAIEVAAKGALAVVDGRRPADPVEAAIHKALRQSPGRFGGVLRAARPEVQAIDDRLAGAGLLVPGGTRFVTTFVSAGLMAAVLALGVAKVVVGAQRDKPVGFLIVGCLLPFFGAMIYLTNPVRRTRAGDAAVNDGNRRHQKLRTDAKARTGDDLMLAVALFGPTLLAGTALADLQAPLRPPSGGGGDGSSSSSSCGGSSCGGSSCGGGGGCGGCGGGGD